MIEQELDDLLEEMHDMVFHFQHDFRCWMCDGTLYINGGTPEAIPCTVCKQYGTTPWQEFKEHLAKFMRPSLQSVHAKAVEQTWKNAHKLAFNWATWEGEYETDTKTVLANLAGTFVNLSRNAPPINQQASHKGQK